MNREIFDITTEPRHETYRALLRASLRWCDQFVFVDVPSPDFGENDSQFGPRAKEVVGQLVEHLVDVQKSKSWPGSTLVDKPGVDTFGRIYRFRLDETAVNILSMAAESLYAWRQPTLPSDLSLIRSDGDPWLVNMAGDGDAYLHLTLEEADRVRDAVPGLELRRHYRH